MGRAAYVFSGNASISAASTLDWGAVFTRGNPTAEAAARANLVHDWPVSATAAVTVPHVVGGRRVGTISAFELLTKEPVTNSARFEGARAIPLCRGAYAVARVSALTPSTDGDSFGNVYTVEGRLAGDWNREQVLATLAALTLEGNLPPRRVTARASGRRVVGTARDCRGDALAGARVRLIPRGPSSTTTANGSFTLRARKRGVYRVAVTVGGSTATSARVRVR